MEKAIKKAQEIAADNQETEQAANAAVENLQQEEQPELPAVTLDELEGMNMEAFASSEEQEGPRQFRITDDGCADWAVRKIAEERAELARIKALADDQIERIKEKVAAAETRCENATSYFITMLAHYFETVPHKKTKTQLSYRLLSGTLKKKIGGQTLKPNNEHLLDYLKKTGNDDLIKTTEEPKWGEFKKLLEIVGGQVVNKETGEIVEGVAIENKADTFTVEA